MGSKQGLSGSDITGRFTEETIREIKRWELEGKVPWKTTLFIWNGYKINTQWQVIWQNGDPLIPRKWKKYPFVIIALNKKDTNGHITPQKKEERIEAS